VATAALLAGAAITLFAVGPLLPSTPQAASVPLIVPRGSLAARAILQQLPRTAGAPLAADGVIAAVASGAPNRAAADARGNDLAPTTTTGVAGPPVAPPRVSITSEATAGHVQSTSKFTSRPFDRAAASRTLAAATERAKRCGTPDRREATRVAVTFAPSGRVTSATIVGDSSLRGTPLGGCVARELRGSLVPQFAGDHVTVHSSIVLR
jgi:hypothetical protein